MSDLRYVERARLAPVLTAFRLLPWPCDRAQLRALADALGWETVLERRKGIDLRTALPVTPDRAKALLPGDGAAVGQVQVYLSDRADGDSDELDHAYRAVVAGVGELLGDPADRQPARKRTCWDLPTGGRLAIARLERVVILDVLGREYADIERAE